ncbi:metal ABC transporter permease [Bacillus alkalicellulosilyticus]|uniref:metal ABC transporter permease n=1 Tax=Alkalihalobacterium alkalicellulosilyticum TaxID=1912214 RepID=UPI00099832A1|nr:metal ABC transporter permease [Bacillus alkalicellulosilyticus]
MLEWMLQLTFIERGIVAAILIGIVCPLLGAFLLVRRISIITESLSHITLTGISAGVLLMQFTAFSIQPLYFGFLFALLSSLLLEKLRQIYSHYQELAVPIVLSTGVGLSAIFISLSTGNTNEWFAYLFGSVLSVTVQDLYFMIVTTLLVVIVIVSFYKEFVAISFDQEFATVSGLRIKNLNFIFTVLVALVIAIAMKVVGILLVGAMIVLPAAAAIRVAKSFKQMVFYSILFGEISMFSGIYLSYHANIATGGGIVLAATVLVVVMILFTSFTRKVERGQGV